MYTIDRIRKELRDVAYYYSRKEQFDKALPGVTSSAFLDTVQKYNEAIVSAPPRLYDLYLCIYVEHNTHEAAAYLMQYSIQYIEATNSKLYRFFLNYFNNKGKEVPQT